MALDVDVCRCNGAGTRLEPSPNPADQIIVRSLPGLEVGNHISKYIENGKTVYELDYLTVVNPIVAFTNDAGVKETGVNVVTVNFSGNITQGTYPINSRSITPDPGGLNLNAPFSFIKSNVKRTTKGNAEVHTVTATDNEGNSTVVSSFVAFNDAFYQGFNELATLDQAGIKALVNKMILADGQGDLLAAGAFGGSHHYDVPVSPVPPKYIYWCGRHDTTRPTNASLNGFALPLYQGHPNIVVTNANDGTVLVSYWVVRTANRFDYLAGGYDINLH